MIQGIVSTGPDNPPATPPSPSPTTTQHHFEHAAAKPVQTAAPAPHYTPTGSSPAAKPVESTRAVKADGAPARVPEGMIRYAPDGRPVRPGGAEEKRMNALEAKGAAIRQELQKDGGGIKNTVNLINAHDRALDRR